MNEHVFSRWRVKLKISGSLVYVSHLDVLSAWERTLRRARLPMRFSSGFNPHMLISFGPAHAVGMQEDALYCDLDFSHQPPDNWPDLCNAVAPSGLQVLEAREIATDLQSLMSAINLVTYELDFTNDNFAIEKFLARESYVIERISPKKKKTVDLRPNVLEVRKIEEQKIALTVRLGNKISPKAGEIARAIAPQNTLKSLRRTGLFIENEQGRQLP
ncbi:MAG: TIGR03936 family radical SAM-associated protein [Bacillota bacterium]|jgi:radical SAM-linked protein